MEERGDWLQTETDRLRQLEVERVVRKEWGFTGDEEWYTKYFVKGAVHNDSDYYDNDSIGGSGGVMATKGGGRKEDHDYNHTGTNEWGTSKDHSISRAPIPPKSNTTELRAQRKQPFSIFLDSPDDESTKPVAKKKKTMACFMTSLDMRCVLVDVSITHLMSLNCFSIIVS